MFHMHDKGVNLGQFLLGTAALVEVLTVTTVAGLLGRDILASDGVWLGPIALGGSFWIARALVRIWTWQYLEVNRALGRLSVIMTNPFRTRRVEIPFGRISRIFMRRFDRPEVLCQGEYSEVRLETVDGEYLSLGAGSEEEARRLAHRISVLTHCRNEALPWRVATP